MRGLLRDMFGLAGIAVLAASSCFAASVPKPALTLGSKNNRLVRGALTLAQSPSGRRLAVTTYGRRVEVLDASTQKVLAGFETADDTSEVRWRSDFSLISAGEKGGLVEWTLGSVVSSRTIRGEIGAPSGLALSPDGSKAAISVFGGAISIVKLFGGGAVSVPKPGHDFHDAPYVVEFSPDGTRLVWSDWKGGVTSWDLTRSTPAWTTRVQGGAVHLLSSGAAGPHYSVPDHVSFLSYSPDGRCLVVEGPHGTLVVLEAETGRIVWAGGGGEGGINALAFMSDGRSVLVSHGRTIRRVAVPEGTVRFSRSTEERVDDFALKPGGTSFLTLQQGGFIGVYDSETGRPALEGMLRTIYSAAFSNDGAMLAAGGSDGAIEAYAMPAGELAWRAQTDADGVFDLAFSPDGRLVISVGGGKLTASEARTGKRLWQVATGSASASSLAILPDGKRIVTEEDDSLVLRDVGTGGKIFALKAHDCSYVRSVIVSQDGRFAAAGCLSGPTFVWDLKARSIVSRPHEPSGTYRWTTPVSFTRDGRRLLAVDDHSQVISWFSIPDGKLISKVEARSEGALRTVMLMPDERTLAVSRDDRLLDHWTLELRGPGGARRELYRDLRGVGSLVARSPDGRSLVTAGDDGRLMVWDLK